MVYQDVTRNSNITAAAKGLYAYLSSLCGVSDECYPSVETIIREMDMGKDTFYRHINCLVAAGVVKKCQIVENGKFGRTLYRLTHEVVISDFPYPQNRDTDLSDTDGKETNINNIKINNLNNNKKESKRFTQPTVEEVQNYCREKGYAIDPERFVDYYTSNGWMVGKSKMKDWKAAVRTWVKRENGSSRQQDSSTESRYRRESMQFMERYANLPTSPDDPFQ